MRDGIIYDEAIWKLERLPSLEHFTTDKKKIAPNIPFKPSSFNEVLPETVLDAVRDGIINNEAISISEVRKALIWRAYNKTTYYFRDDKEVNYHEIVQWAAKKSGVNDEQINNLSTFALETRIIEKYFEAMWDKLDHNQRIAMLNRIEKETGVNLDKNSITTMGGAAALTALAVAAKFVITSISWPVMGSPEKETVSTFIMTVNTIKAKRWGKN